MARKKKPAVSEKTPKSYRLSPRKIAAARRVLGAPSDTAAIEQALDLVVFRDEVVTGTRAILGLKIESFDD